MSVFLAMCQVNIALGILYLNLKESRYREKLIETIRGRLSDSGRDDMDERSTRYTNLLRTDERFAAHHHYILGWVGEFPTQKDKWIKLLDDQQHNKRPWFKRDWRYWWYKGAWDQWWTLIVLVILPILGMWLSQFHSMFAVKLATMLWIVLGLGQLSIVMHVLVGRRMATRIGRQITKKSEYLSRKLNERSADSNERSADSQAAEVKSLLPTE